MTAKWEHLKPELQALTEADCREVIAFCQQHEKTLTAERHQRIFLQQKQERADLDARHREQLMKEGIKVLPRGATRSSRRAKPQAAKLSAEIAPAKQPELPSMRKTG